MTVRSYHPGVILLIITHPYRYILQGSDNVFVRYDDSVINKETTSGTFRGFDTDDSIDDMFEEIWCTIFTWLLTRFFQNRQGFDLFRDLNDG